ncbi:hypothetical protein PSCICO_23370 [Pseudomonas cichorii]|nr:hypothetical protein PSCICO_23370 [Pseudomonas cichorii]
MVTISVYSKAFFDRRRRKYRQWRSVQSIIGATEKRRDGVGFMERAVEAVFTGIFIGRLEQDSEFGTPSKSCPSAKVA